MGDKTFTTESSQIKMMKGDTAVTTSRPRAANRKPAKAKSIALTSTSSSEYKTPSSEVAVTVSLERLPSSLSKSPKAAKLSRTAKSQHPPMLKMVLEALKNNKSKKGLTLQAIKRFITESYPDTQKSFSNTRLRNALLKGLEGNEVIRPKSSEETGLKGHFLFNRTFHVQKEKSKQRASLVKETSSTNDDKQLKKNVSKIAIKKRSALKTVNSGSSSTPKSKTSKDKLSKSPKKELKTISKKKEASKITQKKSAPKSSPPKAPVTPKPRAIPKPRATPKVSKSTKAGVRQKTAAVKKMLKSTG